MLSLRRKIEVRALEIGVQEIVWGCITGRSCMVYPLLRATDLQGSLGMARTLVVSLVYRASMKKDIERNYVFIHKPKL